MNDGTAIGVITITPHDTNFIAEKNGGFPRAFYCGTDGDVAYECWDGSTGTIACTAGTIIPIAVRKILSNGTTATDIVGLY